jgi:mono/diheme cytochrome c family protein
MKAVVKKLLAHCLLVALSLLVGCDSSGTSNRAESGESGPDLSLGLEAYRSQYCGTCHALALAGTAGIFGPTHDGMAALAADRIDDPGYSGSATTPAEYALESIVDPAVYRTPGFERTRFAMPSYAHLDPAQLDALVHLLLHSPEKD